MRHSTEKAREGGKKSKQKTWGGGKTDDLAMIIGGGRPSEQGIANKRKKHPETIKSRAEASKARQAAKNYERNRAADITDRRRTEEKQEEKEGAQKKFLWKRSEKAPGDHGKVYENSEEKLTSAENVKREERCQRKDSLAKEERHTMCFT
ncbi:MAG: hypothetical protein ACI4Q7_02455 [Candidatus Avelusimicrobium sp.]